MPIAAAARQRIAIVLIFQSHPEATKTVSFQTWSRVDKITKARTNVKTIKASLIAKYSEGMLDARAKRNSAKLTSIADKKPRRNSVNWRL